MIKKFFMFALALATCVACDDDHNGPDYEDDNDNILNGMIVDRDPMVFLGTSTVTAPDGTTFVEENARFSIVGDFPTLITPTATSLSLYMHGVRFAEAMPGLEMRIVDLAYVPGAGPNLTFKNEGPLTPQANIAGSGWNDYAKYPITALDGSIVNVNCRIAFTCMGTFRVVFEGRMLDD
ncbi:MAG: hypothetical protein NC250_00370 [Alistipes senegalensis]|nr:hypothetical protein [Bacteroides cellulosilyticus]MCM1351177.1 hypothetical protein [Alistipes senegalensis]